MPLRKGDLVGVVRRDDRYTQRGWLYGFRLVHSILGRISLRSAGMIGTRSEAGFMVSG